MLHMPNIVSLFSEQARILKEKIRTSSILPGHITNNPETVLTGKVICIELKLKEMKNPHTCRSFVLEYIMLKKLKKEKCRDKKDNL